jgi:enamine deaminase RidA (YjgF/YER057c/UK114 family)
VSEHKLPDRLPHRRLDPPTLPHPVGFSHGVLAAPGRVLFLGGQVGWDRAGRFPQPGDLVAQFELALHNLLVVLKEAGGGPEHLVQLRIYVRSAKAWREHAKPIGAVWRHHVGRWYPAMALLEVSGLYEPESLVEIEGTAVVPDRSVRG